jgi:glycosyltransferase involved in cell wall biosynthesis
MRRRLPDWLRLLWQVVPGSTQGKRRFKHALFTRLPWAFDQTLAYRDWAMANGVKWNSAPGLAQGISVASAIRTDDYVPLLDADPPASLPVRLIAFYLPQFHAIPENDGWWGKGFTEWAKVKPSLPLFVGHEQPHVPGELGYYTLNGSEVPRRQIELARRYGLSGFCFYYYWFGGKRLLERPVERYLEDSSLDFPYCLCWANENWSRRWDGREQDLLISQQHSAADDIAFIENVSRFLRDPRYLRINGRPLLLLYRPSLLDSAKETAERWRDWCRSHGIGEIYLAYPQTFDTVDPEKFGFDAAIEFPPHKAGMPNVSAPVEALEDIDVPFVFDWRAVAERSRQYSGTPYTLLRSVCPAWDNSARKGSRGAVFAGSSPALFHDWLVDAVAETCRVQQNTEERLVFVNAWNEWAEGAHLEPDLQHGYAYLQATRNALTGETFVPDGKQRIALVSHDAQPNGAQLLALNLARTLTRALCCDVHLVCLGPGPLKEAFAQTAYFHDLTGRDPRGEEAQTLACHLYSIGVRVAIVNTTVSGLFIESLGQAHIRSIALIHELPGVLRQYALEEHAHAIAMHAEKIVCAATIVAKSFNDFAGNVREKIVVRPQGLYMPADRSKSRAQRREELRQMLGIPSDHLVILGIGYADMRKGVDLFVESALLNLSRHPDRHWVWVGNWEPTMHATVGRLLNSKPESKARIHFPGQQSDLSPFYLGADVFALTSREDPFPSVILEALDAELPVVGFANAGGFADLAAQGAIELVAHGDVTALSAHVNDLCAQSARREALTRTGQALLTRDFSFRDYARFLLESLGLKVPRISVVVPNFNYARYLGTRLNSILNQTVPIHELIFLDDNSSDESLAVARSLLSDLQIDCRIVRNEVNSGSVFSQWSKGIELATGDYVWIAEADDESEPNFLETVMRGFVTPGVVMSYCESQAIDSLGNRLAGDYSAYVAEADKRHWRSHFANDGIDEIQNFLSIINTIPNVSAVVFEVNRLRTAIGQSIDDIRRFRVAGDWRLYVEILREGMVSFNPAALNRHRRHEGGVTMSERRDLLCDEITAMQGYVSEHFDVAPDIAIRARSYLDKLRQAQPL